MKSKKEDEDVKEAGMKNDNMEKRQVKENDDDEEHEETSRFIQLRCCPLRFDFSRMKVWFQKFKPDEWEKAVHRLKKNDPKLTTLRRNHEFNHLFSKLLGKNDEGIGVGGAKTLAKALKSNTALSSLHLDGNQIGDEGAKLLANALKSNTTLSSLFLNNNQIGDEGAKALAQALPNMELSTLYLYTNLIGDEGAKALANALKSPNTKLSTLGLSHNQISVEGAKALANALYTNSTLSVLYLGMNMYGDEGGFGDEGATALLTALKDYNTTLQRIELNDNDISWSLREEIHDVLDLNKNGTRQDLERVQANRREAFLAITLN